MQCMFTFLIYSSFLSRNIFHMHVSWESKRKDLDSWIFSPPFCVWAHTLKNKQDFMRSTLSLWICEKAFWTQLEFSGPPHWSVGCRPGSVRGDWIEILFFFLFWGDGGHADERLIDMVSGALWWIKLCVQTLWPWPVMAVAAFSAQPLLRQL